MAKGLPPELNPQPKPVGVHALRPNTHAENSISKTATERPSPACRRAAGPGYDHFSTYRHPARAPPVTPCADLLELKLRPHPLRSDQVESVESICKPLLHRLA